MEYLVITLPSLYEKVILKLLIKDQKRIDNLIKQLKINPYVGDQLQIKIIREKRLNGKRLYFIVFDDLNAVLIVALSNKKTQQKTIDLIKSKLSDYRGYLKKILGK